MNKVETAVERAESTQPSLSQDDLNVLLHRMEQRFSWRQTAETYVLSEHWIYSAAFYRCRGERTGQPDLVLKIDNRWSADTPRYISESMQQLSEDVYLSPDTVVRMPSALGWDETPPCMCMPYVEGVDLSDLLADLDEVEMEKRASDLAGTMVECGRALGAYHSYFLTRMHRLSREDRSLLVRRLARRLGVRRRAQEAIADALVTSRSYGDIGPHQFRLTTSGDLYIVDPPQRETIAPVHEDISKFTFELRGGAESRGGRQRRRSIDALSEAFLQGYVDSGPIDPKEPKHDFLISVYRAYHWRGPVRRRLSHSQYLRALQAGVPWIRSLAGNRLRRVPS